jgi:hypothetical protein
MSAAKPAGWPHAARPSEIRRGPSRSRRAAEAAEVFLATPPHPNALLAERAAGICLLARLWAQSDHAVVGVRPSLR